MRVFDFGMTPAGDPFVVMELLQGETLGELLARESRLPAIRGVQLLLPIADALASAHAKGIVHRDVKPENIVLARDESERLQPKLLDFGIARFGKRRAGSRWSELSSAHPITCRRSRRAARTWSTTAPTSGAFASCCTRC